MHKLYTDAPSGSSSVNIDIDRSGNGVLGWSCSLVDPVSGGRQRWAETVFGYLLVASLTVMGSWLTAHSAGRNSDETAEGSWVTQMTFSQSVPPGIPPSFQVVETFLSGGDYLSSIAIPFTTGGHGYWINIRDHYYATRDKVLIIGGPGLPFPVDIPIEVQEFIHVPAQSDTYSGTFVAIFSPPGGPPFTLTGTAIGVRVPAPL